MKKNLITVLIFLFSFSGTAIAGNAQKIQDEVSWVIPKQYSVSCKDGKEIQCGMRIKAGNSKTPKDYHDLQWFAREVAVALRNAGMGLDFSIMAIGDHEIPLARFIYSAQFDSLTPIYMWR